MKSSTVHITVELEAAIRKEILKLELVTNRQAVQEGQLIAYREVLRLAHGGIAE